MRALAWAVLALLLPLAARAQTPPLSVDDTGTAPPGGFELHVGIAAEETETQRSVGAPVVEAVYGLSPELEVAAGFAVLFAKQQGQASTAGLGGFAASAKWRFLDAPFAASVTPTVVIPLSVPARFRRLIAGNELSLLLPVEVERSFGPVRLLGEAGWQLVHALPDGWITGVAVGVRVLPPLELLADVVAEGVVGGEPFWLGEAGFQFDLTQWLLLQAAAGRWLPGAVPDQPRFIGYLGLQLLL